MSGALAAFKQDWTHPVKLYSAIHHLNAYLMAMLAPERILAIQGLEDIRAWHDAEGYRVLTHFRVRAGKCRGTLLVTAVPLT
jgi:hypothetical protein